MNAFQLASQINLRRSIRDNTIQLTEKTHQAWEEQALAEFVENARKYPDKYQFKYRKRNVEIGFAQARVHSTWVEILYTVSIVETGEPFDNVSERNVNHPDYENL